MNTPLVVRLSALVVALTGLLPVSAAATVLLYDVDFGTPPHTVGQAPLTGGGSAPRNTISQIPFGDPLVVSTLSTLTAQPCSFGNDTSGYDQIQFVTSGTYPGGFGVSYDTYHVAMLVLVDNLSGTYNYFSVIADLPTVHTVDFWPNGNITVFPGGNLIGTYSLDVAVLLEIDVDVENDTWEVSLDGVSVHSATTTVDDFQSLRVNLDGGYATDSAGIDDVEIYGDWSPAVTPKLYDVDFGAPPHTVGQPPVVGAGPAPRETPTSIVFGNPLVVATLGGLTQQPCQFGNGISGYDQIEFAISSGYPQGFPDDYQAYLVELSMMVHEIVSPPAFDDFSLLLDLPTTHRIDFRNDHTIRAWPSVGNIGTWITDVPVRVTVLVNIEAGRWAIWINGEQVWGGSVTASELRAVRINLDGAGTNDAAAIDALEVWGYGEAATVAEQPAAAVPSKLELLPPCPNPARTGAWIRWETASSAQLSVEIFDVTGRTVWSRPAEAGHQELLWLGVDTIGRPVESGTYFVRLLAGGRALGRQTIVLKR